MPLWYGNGVIDDGKPQLRQRSSVLKSLIRSNWVTFQLLRMRPESRSPSAVSGGMRPLAGSILAFVVRRRAFRQGEGCGILFVGEIRLCAEFDRPLDRGTPDRIDRPDSAQVRVAPRGTRRGPSGRRCRGARRDSEIERAFTGDLSRRP